jgi:hypothetical protein
MFGRVIPIKSNLGYELYQSQVLERDGTLHQKTFGTHPYAARSAARREYKELGEIEFVDRKRELFWNAVANDPLDFCDRLGARFEAMFLWYETFDFGYDAGRPLTVWLSLLTHPLAFAALVFLVLCAIARPLPASVRIVIGMFMMYALPYVVISYYERYALPLIGLKTLLIAFAADRLAALVRRRQSRANP